MYLPCQLAVVTKICRRCMYSTWLTQTSKHLYVNTSLIVASVCSESWLMFGMSGGSTPQTHGSTGLCTPEDEEPLTREQLLSELLS
jgi:hypothetical protein